MKLIMVIAITALIGIPAASAQRIKTVKGSVRSDGTYVAPHVRTVPNRTRADNWSSKPNSNPFTGKRGTVDPYAPKPQRSRRR